MKTAMQELIDFIESTQFPKEGSGNYIYEKAKKLLKKEKEQIIKAYNSAIPFKFGEEYYNQTYKQEIEKL
jgi:hypothetical protein